MKNEQKNYTIFLDHIVQLPTNSKLAIQYKLPKPHQTMKTFHGSASYKKINQTKQLKIVLNKKNSKHKCFNQHPSLQILIVCSHHNTYKLHNLPLYKLHNVQSQEAWEKKKFKSNEQW